MKCHEGLEILQIEEEAIFRLLFHLEFFLQVTYRRMKDTLIQLSKGVQKGPASDLVPVLFGERSPTMSKKDAKFTLFNRNLDHSQVFKFSSFSISVKDLKVLKP